MSNVIAAGLTHVGRVRDHNEDAYCSKPEAGVFMVADGMGGHAAGEVASKMAVDTVAADWQGPLTRRKIDTLAKRGDIEDRRQLLVRLRESVLEASNAISQAGETNVDQKGMGTTFIGFVIAGGEAVFAHVGDSRAYLVRDGIPVLLSEDHTILSRLRATGIDHGIDNAAPDRFKGVLTNAMGMADDTRVSTFVVPIFCADRFVLCTDGVHDYLSEVEVGKLVCSAPSPSRAAQSLVDAALERGGADNATVIVVKIVEADLAVIPSEVRARHDAAIRSCPLFAGLNSQQRLRALRITTPRQYQAKDEIPRVALEDRVAYIVLDGVLRAERGTAEEGEVVLAEALVQPTVLAKASLVAETEVHLLMIRRNDFVELCEDDPDLGVSLYDNLAAILAR